MGRVLTWSGLTICAVTLTTPLSAQERDASGERVVTESLTDEAVAAETPSVDPGATSAEDGAPMSSPEPLGDDGDDDPIIAIGGTSSYDAPFTLAGWVEAFYSWNFNQPSNGITAYRGFDNRHNTFDLANVVLDLHWDWENVVGRIMLQWGTTPATYYLAEPLSLSLGSGAGDSSIAFWQFLQEANVGYRVPIGSGLLVEAGLFISPIGPEGMAVNGDFLFSRSNLFYGLPFYHTGFRFTYHFDDHVALVLWAVNGWNTILDNNDEKSLALQLVVTIDDVLTANAIYFTGVERGTGSTERQLAPGDDVPWRHMLDLNATITPNAWLGIITQLNGGFEPTRLGLAAWVAGALSIRVRPIEWLGLSARGDFFWERVPTGAGAIFWGGSEWVQGTTVGVDLHPEDHVSLRIEYRHDESAGALYYAGNVAHADPTMPSTPWVANARSQDTITIGTTAWF